MKYFTTIIVCLAITLITFGCNQPKGHFNLAPRKITIITEPEGADVVQLRPLDQSPTKLGTTPINDLSVNVMINIKFKNIPFEETQELLKHNNNVVVQINKDGYKQYYGILSTKSGETAVHDIKLQPVE